MTDTRYIVTAEQLRNLAFEAGGAATGPLMRDHPDYVFPSERVKDRVQAVLDEKLQGFDEAEEPITETHPAAPDDPGPEPTVMPTVLIGFNGDDMPTPARADADVVISLSPHPRVTKYRWGHEDDITVKLSGELVQAIARLDTASTRATNARLASEHREDRQ